MTTREENIKKINAELEKLSDEELEKVAGGLMPQNGLRGIQGQRRNEKLSDDELEKVAGGMRPPYICDSNTEKEHENKIIHVTA